MEHFPPLNCYVIKKMYNDREDYSEHFTSGNFDSDKSVSGYIHFYKTQADSEHI